MMRKADDGAARDAIDAVLSDMRRVVKVQWHAHRYEYVYVIETSARPPFEPHWFAGLEREPPG